MVKSRDHEIGYVPTFTEKDEMLGKLSDKILLSNIREQLENKNNNSQIINDMLEVFNTRYNFIINFYNENEDIIQACNAIRRDLYLEIASSIFPKFDIVSDLLDYNNDDFYHYIYEMYKFFILKYKNIISEYFIKKIYDNRKSYQIEDMSNCKDLSYKLIKKELNANDAFIIYNLDNIINEEIERENCAEDLIKDIVSMDEYEITFSAMNDFLVEHKYETYFGNDFIENFFKPLTDDDDYFYDISTLVRNELFTKLKESE